MSRDKGQSSDLQSWGDEGQNRESGGAAAESTPYAAEQDGGDK